MDDMTPRQILDALREEGIVPVVREDEAEQARRVIAILIEAGFGTFEVTLTTPDATEIIADLARSRVFVGAGTVLDAADAERCLAAGARYIVTPCFVDGVVALCEEAGAACILGALTPLEVQTARAAGAQAVKIFPVSSVAGPRHLRALRSVFPDTPLVPTGGVHLDNMTEYLAAGAHFVGVGSDLIDRPALAAGDTPRVAAHANRFLRAIADFRDRDTKTHVERKP